MINDEISLQLKLLKGSPIPFENICTIYPIKLGEIEQIGYNIYNNLLSVLIYDIDDLEDEEESQLKKYDSTFEFLKSNFIEGNYNLLVFIIEAFQFFCHEPIHYNYEFGFFYFGENEDNVRILDKDNYEEFKKILMIQNCLYKKEDEYNPANETTRKFVEKLRKNKKKKAKMLKNKNSDFSSIISGVAWKIPNINIFNIWDLTIYQIYDAYYRLSIIDKYNHVFNGIYAGTIDSKEINIKDIDWIKKIKK